MSEGAEGGSEEFSCCTGGEIRIQFILYCGHVHVESHWQEFHSGLIVGTLFNKQ